MYQPPAEKSQVSIEMINQAQVISDYISEGLEPEYDVEEQWCFLFASHLKLAHS